VNTSPLHFFFFFLRRGDISFSSGKCFFDEIFFLTLALPLFFSAQALLVLGDALTPQPGTSPVTLS